MNIVYEVELRSVLWNLCFEYVYVFLYMYFCVLGCSVNYIFYKKCFVNLIEIELEY